MKIKTILLLTSVALVTPTLVEAKSGGGHGKGHHTHIHKPMLHKAKAPAG